MVQCDDYLFGTGCYFPPFCINEEDNRVVYRQHSAGVLLWSLHIKYFFLHIRMVVSADRHTHILTYTHTHKLTQPCFCSTEAQVTPPHHSLHRPGERWNNVHTDKEKTHSPSKEWAGKTGERCSKWGGKVFLTQRISTKGQARWRLEDVATNPWLWKPHKKQ